MELGYYNYSNVKYDDDTRIIRYERKKMGSDYLEEEPIDFYIIGLYYSDGTYKEIRVYCEHDTSSKLGDEKEKEKFFIKRLFGKDGLIIKERRNDYIYLGGIAKDKKEGYSYSRYNIFKNGKTYQEAFDESIMRDIKSSLSFKNISEEWDLINIDYYYHTGAEDMQDIFKNGMRSRFGSNGRKGFCHLESTFYHANSAFTGVINNLYDSVRYYGDITTAIGDRVFIIKIPKIYRGKTDENGILYPPLPTHKMINYETGDCIIIPEIIYGMYDTKSGKLYKNPNYRTKYNPDGLVYDEAVAEKVQPINSGWYNFINQRREIPYDKLVKYDRKNDTFEQIRAYYGINEGNSGKKTGKR